jgi:hypothetical protein
MIKISKNLAETKKNYYIYGYEKNSRHSRSSCICVLEAKMKKFFVLFLFITVTALAAQYGVYDPQGNLLSQFSAESYDLPTKAVQMQKQFSHRNVYLAPLSIQRSNQKPTVRYRYVTGVPSYIETKPNEVFSLCPEEKLSGVWASEYSVSVSSDNCLTAQSPSQAISFKVLLDL